MCSFTDACFDAMEFTDCHDDYPELRDADGWSDALVERIERDCAEFQEINAEALAEYEEAGFDLAQAGHDFWLTRNGHGAGFWDRDLPGDLGDYLTNACRSFGSLDLYAGDDNMIHGS